MLPLIVAAVGAAASAYSASQQTAANGAMNPAQGYRDNLQDFGDNIFTAGSVNKTSSAATIAMWGCIAIGGYFVYKKFT